MIQRGSILATLLLTVLMGVTAVHAATPCEQLASMALPNARIDSAQLVAAGAFVPPAGGATTVYQNLPAFCRVAATLSPTSDSDIKTETWLPAAGWNGKFLAVGNGGWAGTIRYPDLAAAVAAGYAGASTDTGHTGASADFALGHPEKIIDFAHRSIHEMTVQSKSIINAHYGSPARLSYYNGCSQGGRQGIAAAQHYPEDFNGIIAGASLLDLMRTQASRIPLNLRVNKDADSVIPPNKYAMIHQAVLNSCDALDGLKDGVMENPAVCTFNYASLLCKGGDGRECLTKGQVESANTMISPVMDPKTGEVLYEGHLVYGSELGWGTLGGPDPIGLAVSGLRNIAFQDRSWDYRTMNIRADFFRASKSDNGVLRSNDPNLKPFFERGGKLLMYHGWSDPQVPPYTSISYFNNVLGTVGKDAENSIALFMVPGMNHCSGGPGVDTFAKIQVLEQWVEQDIKPSRIVASHLTNGQVDKTRPLCPLGQIAKYNGTGDVNNADNFTCTPVQ